MNPYPKTENLFKRDPDTHKLIIGDLRDPVWSLISHWHVTEKVDGTNIRVIITPSVQSDGEVTYHAEVKGRSDNATIPPGLHQAIFPDGFDLNAAAQTFYDDYGLDHTIIVTLYGEGYGAGIQKSGKLYSDTKQFALFDVTTTNQEGQTWWRDRLCVQFAEVTFGFRLAPVIDPYMRINTMVDYVQSKPISIIALRYRDKHDNVPMEGVIARTDPYLYDFRGSRIMFKLKTEDIV